MASQKTIITGEAPRDILEDNPIYRRSDEQMAGKTYIPDVFLNGGAGAEQKAERVERTLRLQDRVVAGVMFSVSRTPQGELFPLYLGRNTIGSAPECDIRLDEETVSPRHATIAVRRIQTEEGNVVFTASILDDGSEHGTTVDGRRIDYERAALTDDVMIGVGRHYTMLIHLFDTVKRGMYADDDFRLIDRPEEKAPEAAPEENYASSIGEADEMNFYGRSPKKPK